MSTEVNGDPMVKEWLQIIVENKETSAAAIVQKVDALLGANFKGLSESQKSIGLEKLSSLFESLLADCKAKYGSVETRRVHVAVGETYFHLGMKVEAVAAFKRALEVNVGIGAQLDVCFSLVKVGLSSNDDELVTESLARSTKEMGKSGCDWERATRLRVLRCMQKISKGSSADRLVVLRECVKELCACMSTFNGMEGVLSLTEFVVITVVLGTLTLNRLELKSKLVDSPEVNTVCGQLPALGKLLSGLYTGNYRWFFGALVPVLELCKKTRFISGSCRFIARQLRHRAYRQYLSSFSVVSLQGMADDCGVKVDFLRKDVARAILAESEDGSGSGVGAGGGSESSGSANSGPSGNSRNSGMSLRTSRIDATTGQLICNWTGTYTFGERGRASPSGRGISSPKVAAGAGLKGKSGPAGQGSSPAGQGSCSSESPSAMKNRSIHSRARERDIERAIAAGDDVVASLQGFFTVAAMSKSAQAPEAGPVTASGA